MVGRKAKEGEAEGQWWGRGRSGAQPGRNQHGAQVLKWRRRGDGMPSVSEEEGGIGEV